MRKSVKSLYCELIFAIFHKSHKIGISTCSHKIHIVMLFDIEYHLNTIVIQDKRVLILKTGPAQQDFEWGGGGGGGGGLKREPGFFFFGEGGWVLVTLRYRKVNFKLTNSVLR